MNCKDCKHWTKFAGKVDTGRCAKIEYEITVYIHSKDDDAEVSFITTEDTFGCVLFEQRGEV